MAFSTSRFFRSRGGVSGQSSYGVGSFSFVVPAGVTAICIAAIGGGQGGGSGSIDAFDTQTPGPTGSGGELRYINAVAVTPGETLNVVVGNGSVGNNSGPNTPAGAASPTTIKRGATTILHAAQGPVSAGAGSGGTSSAGSTPKSGAWPGGGYGLTGNGGSSTIGDGGFGGAPDTSEGFGGYSAQNGQGGGLRIIWGAGRSYPANAA